MSGSPLGGLPTITTLADGRITYETVASGLTVGLMALLFEEGGSALIVDAGPDEASGAAASPSLSCDHSFSS